VEILPDSRDKTIVYLGLFGFIVSPSGTAMQIK